MRRGSRKFAQFTLFSHIFIFIFIFWQNIIPSKIFIHFLSRERFQFEEMGSPTKKWQLLDIFFSVKNIEQDCDSQLILLLLNFVQSMYFPKIPKQGIKFRSTQLDARISGSGSVYLGRFCCSIIIVISLLFFVICACVLAFWLCMPFFLFSPLLTYTYDDTWLELKTCLIPKSEVKRWSMQQGDQKNTKKYSKYQKIW